MADLLFSVNTVFPLLVMMAVGYAARKMGILGEKGTDEANNAVFHIFLPLLLCFNIMDTNIAEVPDLTTILIAIFGTLAAFGGMFLLAPRLCEQRSARGVLIQGVCRSNYAIFGIPLVLMMYPNQSTAIASVMVLAVVPLFNVLSVIALSVYGNEKTSVGGILRSIVFNPLILGMLAGFVLWRFQISLPALIEKPLRSLGGVATPLALFLLGASLDFSKAKAHLGALTIGVAGRLVVVPLIFLTVAVALGVRGVNLATLIAVFASPTAVSSYPMAQQMGGNADLAAAQVAFTTVFSILTVFLFVLTLKSIGAL